MTLYFINESSVEKTASLDGVFHRDNAVLHTFFFHFVKDLVNGLHGVITGGLTKIFHSGKMSKGGLRPKVGNGCFFLGESAGGDDLVKNGAQGSYREIFSGYLVAAVQKFLSSRLRIPFSPVGFDS